MAQLRERAARGETFDGDLAFLLADERGYPAELSAEEAVRIGMPVDPAWEERYEALVAARRERFARSRWCRQPMTPACTARTASTVSASSLVLSGR